MSHSAPKSTQSKKRLFVCCDGTWNDSVSTDSPLTNVSRLSRCIKEVADDGTMQIVYYHTGVGTGTSRFSSTIDAATGRGIHANIRDAYSFICNNFNFEHGEDEIFLIGFSRGAFTVRCVAALIDQVGLLTKLGLVHVQSLYKLWVEQQPIETSLRLHTPWATMTVEIRPQISTAIADPTTLDDRIGQLQGSQYLKRSVRIKACAVWDTVSALGNPLLMSLRASKNAFEPNSALPRVDTHVPESIDFAFHALALHERRKHFSPDLWHSHEPTKTTLKQCWFLGTHSDVGGGGKDTGLASISLLWMLSELSSTTGAEFAMKNVMEVVNPLRWDWTANMTRQEYLRQKTLFKFPYMHGYIGDKRQMTTYIRSRPVAVTGQVSNSMKGVFVLAGSRLRKPGCSRRSNDLLCEPIRIVGPGFSITRTFPTPLPHTGVTGDSETIHFTVRVLMASQALRCPALESYETKYEEQMLTWRSETATLGPGNSFARLFKSRSKQRQSSVVLREEKAPSSETEMLRICLESSDIFLPPTQLAQLLLPLLGESESPTLHYPPSSLPTQ